jgi:phage gp29-like protein
MNQLGRLLTRYSRDIDGWRRYLTDDPSPSNFAALLKQVDAGDMAAMVELSEEMEAKDSHFQNVAERRRESLTALDWRIQPNASDPDQATAGDVAEFCETQLRGLRSWPDTLEHLATAIGPGVAVTELLWHRGRIVHTRDVPGHRLMGHLTQENPGVYVETTEDKVNGVRARSPKFIVFCPCSRAGFPLRVTPARANAYLWVIKHYATADWASFTETYGQPARVATYDGEISPKERKELQEMLKNMGSDLWAMFKSNVDVKFIEAARNNQPFEGMIDWIERKQSILYLGQTLTTDTQGIGSLALGKVHEGVRASITLSDIQKEARVIRNQVLRPMVRMRWPGMNLQIPEWTRVIADSANVEQDTLKLEKLRFMAERGLPVDDEVIYDWLGVPIPKRCHEN